MSDRNQTDNHSEVGPEGIVVAEALESGFSGLVLAHGTDIGGVPGSVPT